MFNLPRSTEVDKIIPKNAFDAFTNTKQKKAISEKLLRIKWVNKLSSDTTNLQGKELEEIQVFDVELKEKTDIKDILVLINKAIPYSIIFILRFEELLYLSTSPKHINPNKENSAVIDYTFNSGWINKNECNFTIDLKNSLDWVYNKFCEQFSVTNVETSNLTELVEVQKNNDALLKEIEKLKSAIPKCKQFNKKVELNMRLKALQAIIMRSNDMKDYIV